MDVLNSNDKTVEMSDKFRRMFKQTSDATDILKLIANESRLLVLCQLNEAERSVGKLEELVGLSQSALSQHLAKLRKYGVVKTKRKGQQIFYEISDWRMRALIETLYDLFCTVRNNEITNN